MTGWIRTLRCAGPWLLLALAMLCAAPARAHDPFDGNIHLVVFESTIEARITLGYDATRILMRHDSMTPVESAQVTRASSAKKLLELPLAIAPRLVTLHAAGQPVLPTSVMAAPGDVDINLIVVYPRPATASIDLRAGYFDLVEDMRPGMLVALGSDRRVIMSTLLDRSRPGASVVLSAPPATGSGARTFFMLGIEHILIGFDHLLFLLALLVGVQRLGPMLGIISAFTVAHSLTLALAALGLVDFPAAVIEPLIAASILVVCVENVIRRNATTDRYWMAGLFGLIHGFGFAGILRDMGLGQGGNGIVVPLLSFNLGVETGQLLMAAVTLPLLMWLRKAPPFARHGTAAVSALVACISAYWLVTRL